MEEDEDENEDENEDEAVNREKRRLVKYLPSLEEVNGEWHEWMNKVAYYAPGPQSPDGLYYYDRIIT